MAGSSTGSADARLKGPNPLLTAREVADTFGVTAETVLRWTRHGDLPAIRLPGGALRYDRTELSAWLSGRTTGSTGRRSTLFGESG